jgi:hypothetical protein
MESFTFIVIFYQNGGNVHFLLKCVDILFGLSSLESLVVAGLFFLFRNPVKEYNTGVMKSFQNVLKKTTTILLEKIAPNPKAHVA